MTLMPGDPVIWKRKRATPLMRDLEVQATFVRHLRRGAIVRVKHPNGIETEHVVDESDIEPARAAMVIGE